MEFGTKSHFYTLRLPAFRPWADGVPAHGVLSVVKWGVSQGEVDVSVEIIIELVLVEQARQKVRCEGYEESLQAGKRRTRNDNVLEKKSVSSQLLISRSSDSRWRWRTGVTELPGCWTTLRCSGRVQPPAGGTRTQTCGRPDGFPPSCWGAQTAERGGTPPRRWWWSQTGALQQNESFSTGAM